CVGMEGAGRVREGVVERLKREGGEVISVRVGESYRRRGEREYEIRMGAKRDYEEMLKDVICKGGEVEEVVHLWSTGEEGDGREEINDEERFEREQQRGFYSLLCLAQAIEASEISGVVKVRFVSRGLQDVESSDAVAAEKATALGACKVISQECEKLKCRSIDVGEATVGRPEAMVVDQLVDEIKSESEE